jgi:hypothetical protein
MTLAPLYQDGLGFIRSSSLVTMLAGDNCEFDSSSALAHRSSELKKDIIYNVTLSKIRMPNLNL